ncbi:MAG: tetratricopeptide repeat protein [Bryobacteraceae bacterium]
MAKWVGTVGLGLWLLILACPAQSVSTAPSDLATLQRSAQQALKQQDWVRAVDLYRRLTRLRPQSMAAWGNLGNALKHLGRYDEAAGALAKAERLDPNSPAVRLDQALVYIAAHRYREAIPPLQAGLRLQPGNAKLLQLLGLCQLNSRQYRSAVHSLTLAQKQAVAPPGKASHDKSLATQAHFLLGVAYFQSKNYSKAIAELTGLAVEPAVNQRALYIIEESNRRTGHVQAAEKAFKELIARYPDSAWADYLVGNAYDEQKQFGKAIEQYKQALQKDPEIPNAEFAIGYIYWREQETAKAREWLEKQAQKSCGSLANFYLGEIARAAGHLSQAEARYRRALQCDPSSSKAHLRLGMVLADQKQYTEAIAELKKAIRLNPNSSSAHYHLGQVYSQMGQAAAAKAEYKKVRQILAEKNNGVPASGMASQ